MKNTYSESAPPQYPCITPIASFAINETECEVEVLVHGSSYGSFSCDRTAIELFRSVQPLLDGSHSIDSLCIQLGRDPDRDNDVFQLLAELNRFHLLVDLAPNDQEPGEQSPALCQLRWNNSTSQCANSVSDLSGFNIGIICNDPTGFAMVDGLSTVGAENLSMFGPNHLFDAKDTKPLIQTLGNRIPAEIKITGYDNFDLELCTRFCKNLDFVVVALCGAMAEATALDINQLLYSNKTKSLLVRMKGSSILLGPLCIPGTETCCYAEILTPNPFSPVGETAALVEFDAPCGPTPYFLSAGYFVAAMVSDVLVKGRRIPFSNQLWTADWTQFGFQSSRILKNPRCPVCGRHSHIPEGRPLDE